jgi:hypothetical protein
MTNGDSIIEAADQGTVRTGFETLLLQLLSTHLDPRACASGTLVLEHVSTVICEQARG